MTKPHGQGWLGILSLILGIFALLLAWIPFFGFILCVIAIVISGIGLSKVGVNKGLAITGLVLGILGLLTAIVISIFAGGLILLGTQLAKDATPSIEGQEGEQPSELILKVGETAKTSRIEVTVLSAEKTGFYSYSTDYFGEPLYQKASSGKQFLIAEIQIKNVGADRVYISSGEFSATDSEGTRYDTEFFYYGDDGLDMFQELYQNQKTEGKILFEVGKEAEDLEIIYDFGDIFTGTSLAKWKVN